VVEELKDEEEVATPVKGSKNKKKAAPVEAEDQEMEEAPAPVPTPKSALKKQKASPAAPKTNGTPVSEKKSKKTTKKSAPAKEVEEEETVPASDDAEDDNEEEELDEQTKALVEALEDDEDSETEQAKDKKQKSTYKEGQDVGKIPKQKKASKAAAAAAPPAIKGKPGVIYLARIPHGFYEHQIRSYFEQFGPINHIRVARNKKTGASRHRAFIEFAEADTADVAARTMDKYLLFGHLLTAKVVPESQVHANLFKGSNRRFKVVPWNKMQGKQLEKALPESKWAGKITKEEERRAKRAEKLKAIGYEFEAPALKVAEAKEVVAIEEKEEAKAIEAPVEEEKKEEVVEEKEVAAVEETKAEATPVKKSPAAKKGSATKATKRSRRSSTKL